MFTGIVEKSARVIGVVGGPKFTRLNLAADWPDVRHGESIAVNGVCLTVREHDRDGFTVGARCAPHGRCVASARSSAVGNGR